MLESIIVIALATWRVTHLICYERGPYDVVLRFRRSFGFEHDDDGIPIAWPQSFFAQLLACPWCLSVWIAVVGSVVWAIEPWVVAVVSVMGIAAMITALAEALRRP